MWLTCAFWDSLKLLLLCGFMFLRSLLYLDLKLCCYVNQYCCRLAFLKFCVFIYLKKNSSRCVGFDSHELDMFISVLMTLTFFLLFRSLKSLKEIIHTVSVFFSAGI